MTSDLGALAETTRGHATLVPAARPGSEGLVAFGEAFAEAALGGPQNAAKIVATLTEPG